MKSNDKEFEEERKRLLERAQNEGSYLDSGINELKKLGGIEKDWGQVKKLRHQIQKKDIELTKTLDALCVQLGEMNDLLKRAYYSCPKVDVNNFLASPLSPNMVWSYLKNHLYKRGLTQVGYVASAHKSKDFNDSINEGLRWLVKLEKKVQGPEAVEVEDEA